jgi:quercetin dioxygenase-like cupin family protein
VIVLPGRPAGAGSTRRDDTFTGEVWADPVLPASDGVLLNTIFFQPGARTFWHQHERGQILLVLHGEGLVGARGEPPQVVRAGDVVWTPPGEEHWHGATPDALLCHLAVSLGTTTWAGEVLAGDYQAAAADRAERAERA